eukprot:g6587.t1
MAKTLAWFERELRRLLGFEEVEEIARFALDSFPVSQPVELKQYLEQFLGQSKEVDKLCNELSVRRKGEAPAKKSSPQTAQSDTSWASDDFWGGGGSGGASRGGTGGVLTTKSSGRSVAAEAAAGTGRRGQQIGKTSPHVAGKGKGKGRVYQKAAAEEDFWGGGTTSGRSKTRSRQSSSSSAKPGSTTLAAVVPAAVSAEAVASVPPPAVAVATYTRQGGTPGANTRGSAGDKLSPSTANSTAKKQASKQPPSTSASSKPASYGKLKAAAAAATTPSPTVEAKRATTSSAAAAAPTPAPEWSGVTCLCMGKTHDVVTNCTTCGKIACVKEGGFGCSFCGSALPVTGREPRKIDVTSGMGRGGGGVAKGNPTAAPQQSAALKAALERKDRLLLFDRTSASRTRVLDDQGDYFTSHNWLSQGEREKGEAEEKARRDDAASRRGARRQVKMSIDIMGRRVIETQETVAGGGATAAVAAAGTGEEEEGMTRSEGVSLDFGSSSSPSTGAGAANGGSGIGDPTAAAAGKGGPAEGETPGPETERGPNQRVSLENTGLRGRAKEVYDVMRANLDKKNRRRPGGGGAAAGLQMKSGSGVAESSRVGLWRVQHDVDSDDLLRQSPPGGEAAVGGVGYGLERFEPADEAACAR